MKVKEFNEIVAAQIKRSTDILCVKANEYATEDRLHNFKVAAELQGCSPKKALAGMMAKHTVSIYDLCMSSKPASIEMWDEKITDHINYLLLLKAVVSEDAKCSISGEEEKHNEKTYYKVCKDCGATLDPGERCDCGILPKETAQELSIMDMCEEVTNNKYGKIDMDLIAKQADSNFISSMSTIEAIVANAAQVIRDYENKKKEEVSDDVK